MDSKDSLATIDTEVISQLTQVADTLTAMVSQLMQSQEGQTTKFNYFRESLRETRDSIRKISQVLHEGNGQRPLVARVAVLETQIAGLEDDLEELGEQLAKNAQNKEQASLAERKGRYAVAVALVTGICSLAASIIQWVGG